MNHMIRHVYSGYRRVTDFLASNTTVFIAAIVLLCAYLYGFPDDFKVACVVSLMALWVVYAVCKNFILSVFLLSIITIQYLFPAKNYPFILASPLEYQNELLPNGYIDFILLNISDIFIVLLSVTLFTKFVIPHRQTPHPSGLFTISRWYLFSWATYTVLSIASSLSQSAFPYFSLNVTLQYTKAFIIYFAVVNIIRIVRQSYGYICLALTTILSWQLSVGIIQFLFNFSPAAALQNTIPLDSEENLTLYRIHGIATHANQHAFFIMCLYFLTYTYVRSLKNKWIFVLLTSLTALNIAATQSRTVLVIVGMYIAYIVLSKQSAIITGWIKRNKQGTGILVIVATLTIYIVLQRAMNINTFFQADGGLSLRKNMISDGLLLINQSPWLGFGPGAVVRAFLNNLPNGYIYTFPQPVHFAYMQIALESGIPAVFLFFFPIFHYIWMWVANRSDRQWYNASQYYIFCLLGIMIYYCAQPPWGRVEFYLIGLAMGLSMRFYRQSV